MLGPVPSIVQHGCPVVKSTQHHELLVCNLSGLIPMITDFLLQVIRYGWTIIMDHAEWPKLLGFHLMMKLTVEVAVASNGQLNQLLNYRSFMFD